MVAGTLSLYCCDCLFRVCRQPFFGEGPRTERSCFLGAGLQRVSQSRSASRFLEDGFVPVHYEVVGSYTSMSHGVGRGDQGPQSRCPPCPWSTLSSSARLLHHALREHTFEVKLCLHWCEAVKDHFGNVFRGLFHRIASWRPIAAIT